MISIKNLRLIKVYLNVFSHLSLIKSHKREVAKLVKIIDKETSIKHKLKYKNENWDYTKAKRNYLKSSFKHKRIIWFWEYNKKRV